MKKTPFKKLLASLQLAASPKSARPKTFASPKSAAIFCAAITFCANVFALDPPQDFCQALLSNGMAVFVCEDFSAPTVTIEYAARAGFSSQSAATAGYAPLCAELFAQAGRYSSADALQSGDWLLDGLQSECLADSARHQIQASPSQTEEIFRELSHCAFAPIYPDQDLAQKWKDAKERAAQSVFSAEGFINGAIDSRVFSAAPWKHDSGIYPALFETKSLFEARSALSEFAKRFYAPQNSALFVTGAIKKEAALALAQKTFGQFAPAARAPQEDERLLQSGAEAIQAQNGAGKKFVLSDPELSSDMAQAVFQYTSLTMEQADIAAAILDARSSALKAALASQSALNIRGHEYINAGAAHKNASSRLIIQALLEKGTQAQGGAQAQQDAGGKKNSKAPKTAGAGADPCDYFSKATLFEKILRQEIFNFTKEEFEAAKYYLCLDFEGAAASPRALMDLLSQFWAVDGAAKKSWEQSGQAGDAASLLERFLARQEKIMAQGFEELKFALQAEEPFEFILLNSKSFAPLAAQFKKAGWQSVTAKNASWHAQETYSKIKASLAQKPAAQKNGGPEVYDQNFVQKSRQSAKTALLSNSIALRAKTNGQSAKSAVCLYIKGGESQCAQRQPGLEAVVTNILALNARAACAQKISQGLMKNAAVDWQTGDISSLVTVECLKGDEEAALECLFEALVFSEAVPAQVDACISSRKSAQIIKNGAMARQLYSAAIKAFYKGGLCRALYSEQKDILRNVPFALVLEECAKLLDAGRLEIIAVGNFSFESLAAKAQELFGGLGGSYKESAAAQEIKASPKTAQRVKINHTFLTDVSAEKAGPRPAVLIPTTDFADPAQYWFCAPQSPKEAALFDALMTALLCKLQKVFAASERYQKMTARIEEKSPLVAFGAITIFNVQYVSDADAAMQKALAQLRQDLEGGANPNGGKNPALDAIKSEWLKAAFEGADQNSAAAKMIAQKIDQERVRLGGQNFDAQEAILADYEAATQADAQDFLAVYESCFEKRWKFYSADAKK